MNLHRLLLELEEIRNRRLGLGVAEFLCGRRWRARGHLLVARLAALEIAFLRYYLNR